MNKTQEGLVTKWPRNVAIFLASQSISLFGSSLVQFAITWYITLTTQSGLAMTISVVCGYLPQLFVSLFAGVWADRYNRKRIIMLSDGITALSTLVLAIVFLQGYQQLWLLYVVSAIRAFGSALQSPAVSAVIPSITPEDRLMRVNAVNGSIQSFLSLAAPALAGLLLTATGSIVLIFFIDVVTAAIAIFCMAAFLKMPSVRRSTAHSGTEFDAIKQGFSYIRKHSFLIHLFVYVTIISIMIAPIAMLIPLQIVRTFGEEVWYITAVQVALAIGMLVGGLLISSWGGFKNRVHTMLLAVLGISSAAIVLGLQIPFTAYLGVIFVAGMMMPIVLTPVNVVMQERVDDAYLGRVFSVMSMISGSMTPLGMVLFGPLADRIPISWLLIGAGIVILIAGAVLSMDKVALRAGAPQPKEE